ncbi:MAG: glycosyltransferase family 2 protein, partial [Patescibacteria group bacterium]
KSLSQSDFSGLEKEIIVVDNNSRDDIKIILANTFPKVKIISSEKNLGMGAGNNLGIREARGEVLLILNPDTIIKNNSIKILFNYLKNNQTVGIVAPKLIYPDNKLQISCFREWKFFTPILRRTFLGKLTKKHLNNFLMNDFDHNTIKEVDWIMGSCFLIKKEVFNIVGNFDERFFMYFEDSDLCRRVRNAKYQVIYNPEAIVIHDHARESAQKPWYLAPFVDRLAREHIKSWIKYFWKWSLVGIRN